MINFSEVKSFSIPEGEVTELTIGGKVVWKLPQAKDYTFMEYLQFNKDKRFDTGIICTEATKIEITFTKESNTTAYVYGVRNSGNTASVYAYFSNSGYWQFGNKYKSYILELDTIHNATIDKSGITMNGTKTSFTSDTFTANATLVIGTSRRNDGTMPTAQYIGKIYSFKMYNNNELILDWKPCKKADGTEGFFDTVTNQFISEV